MSGLTLDAGALIALDRGDRRVIALIERVTQRGFRITIPTTALAQVVRNPARQVRLRRLLGNDSTEVIPLSEADATAVGLLLARSGSHDIVDAHVALCAERAGQAVVTSDPDDLMRLAPGLRLVVV